MLKNSRKRSAYASIRNFFLKKGYFRLVWIHYTVDPIHVIEIQSVVIWCNMILLIAGSVSDL